MSILFVSLQASWLYGRRVNAELNFNFSPRKTSVPII